MKQTAIEWYFKLMQSKEKFTQEEFDSIYEQAKEMERQQQLELIQFLAEREDFKENSSISIFIAEDYLNQFKNK